MSFGLAPQNKLNRWGQGCVRLPFFLLLVLTWAIATDAKAPEPNSPQKLTSSKQIKKNPSPVDPKTQAKTQVQTQAAPEAVHIHQKMRESLGGLKNRSFNFQVTQISPFVGDTSYSQGSLILGPKGQFHLKVTEQEWIYNGKWVWQVSHPQKQVLLQGADSAIGFQHPNKILTAFLDCPPYAMQIVTVNNSQMYRLSLLPGRLFAEADSLWVRGHLKTGVPDELGFLDREGASTVYKLGKITHKKSPASYFEYKKPKEYELLDMRVN